MCYMTPTEYFSISQTQEESSSPVSKGPEKPEEEPAAPTKVNCLFFV